MALLSGGPSLRLGLALALALGAMSGRASAAGEALAEYQVKAAFLVNFARFIDWPASAFVSDTAPIVISIVGEDPFGASLDQAVRNARVNGRPIVVKRQEARDGFAGVHMLFVSDAEARRLPEIHKAVGATVTVSEVPGVGAAGSVITFVLDHDRVRFEINLDPAVQRNIKIRTKLLALATVVHGNGK